MKIQKGYNILSVLAIAVLGFLQTCNSNGKDVNLNIGPKVTEIITDTVTVVETIVESKTDTLWQTQYVSLPSDTVFKNVEVVAANTHTPRPSIKQITGNQNDDTVDIKYNAMVEGELLSLNLDYKLKKPVTIYKVDTVKIKETQTIEKIKYKAGLYLGGNVGYEPDNQRFSTRASLMLTTPKRVAYQYQYDLLNKEHSVGLHYRLFKVGK